MNWHNAIYSNVSDATLLSKIMCNHVILIIYIFTKVTYINIIYSKMHIINGWYIHVLQIKSHEICRVSILHMKSCNIECP